MALQQHTTQFHRLTPDDLAPWRAIPPAVASDCMNRTQVMHARMKPLTAGQTLCGQARTVVTMAGDCLAPVPRLAPLNLATSSSSEIRVSGLVMFGTDSVPRGPHQGFGGTLD